MRFNIYKRFQLDILRDDGTWVVYRVDAGKRVRMNDLVVPSELAADEPAVYLDDLFHELAGFGREVERMPDDDDSSAAQPS